MTLGFILFGIVAIWIVTVWVLRSDDRKPWREGMSGAQTVFGSIAIIIAAVWYFQQRPDAPKVKLSVSATAYPQSTAKAVILVDVEIENIGSTSLDFSGDRKLRLFLQRLELPPTGRGETSLFEPADNWPGISHLYDQLDTVIEAGERENYYYRVGVSCAGDKDFVIGARLPKPRKFYDILGIGEATTPAQALWVRQTTVDLSSACGDANENASVNAARKPAVSSGKWFNRSNT